MSVLDRDPRGNIPSPAGSNVTVDLTTLSYTNPRIPAAFNGNAENVLNFLVATAFPNYKATVANPAALPGSASPNDYYIVSDDGDGKSAGYVWVVRDNAGGFEKKYDVDWSYEGIYSETLNRTSYVYVSKLGTTDKDASGNAVTGLYAGQKIYGGDATNQNLTFNANSADNTGYVQTDNIFRPTSDNVLDLGTAPLRWKTGRFATSVLVGTLTIQPGSISDSGGTLSFGSNAISTTGSITGNSLSITTNGTFGTTTVSSGSISSSGGALSFGSNNTTTTGTSTASSGIFGTLTLTSGSITDSGGTISFGTAALSTTGTLSAGITTVTQLNSGNLRVTGNTLSSTNTNGNINITPNGTGIINFSSAATTLGISATGNISATGTLTGGNLQISGNTLSSTDTNGNINLSPNGTGLITVSAIVRPTTDAARDLATPALRFKDIYFSGALSDGTTSIAQSVLQSLRGINVGVTTGMSLFWTGSQWQPSIPDTEITHNTLSGLTTGDAGHTQFVLLTGRSGGQIIQGGTAASENLTLESTAHATKGLVYTKDNFVPFTNASYSSGWLGTDLGGSSNFYRDVYTKGEHKGFRFENLSSLPSNSTQNIGRGVFNTSDNKLYLDTGTAWTSAGGTSVEKFSSDTVWDGSTTVKNVDVSATISEARTALWQLKDNSNNFEIIYTKIEATSATNVRITVNPALPAGSYRLNGIN